MSNANAPLNGVTEASAGAGSSVGIAVGTSYTQLIAATAYESIGFDLMLTQRTAGSDTDFSVGIGSAGNEFAVVDRFSLSNAGSTYCNGTGYYFPLRVPQGSRVAVKLGTASSTVYASIILNSPGSPGLVANGAYLERAGPALVDGGAAANTKGAWVSIGTNARPWKGLYIVPTTDGGGSGVDFLYDVAIDLSGTKQVLWADLPAQKGSAATLRGARGPVFGDFPAGTAFYARCQCSGTSTLSRKLNVYLHGIVV